MDKIEIFTNNQLNYDTIKDIYERVVREGNNEEAVDLLPNISDGFDEFLDEFGQQISKMENFSEDAKRIYKAFEVCILFMLNKFYL